MNDAPNPPDLLAAICTETAAETARRAAATSLSAIRALAEAAPPTRGFAQALRAALAAGRYGLIAEIKRASPSGGSIREPFDPAELARAYSQGGASCLSVLTDFPHFRGELAHLHQAREAVALPVLRKDFILDEWQVHESRAAGADCILLILAALSDQQARDLEQTAHALGLDVLVEVHDRAELDRALRLRTPLVGINNRDLRTLRTDIETTASLGRHVPADRILVTESGISTADDVQRTGARCMLVGESLLRQPDIAAATRALLAGPAGLTHFDGAGRAIMVDAADKPATARTATARARVAMQPATLATIMAGSAAKGDVLGIARIAGIMAAKRTAELIPLCHPLAIAAVTLELTPGEDAIEIEASVKTTGPTGVEMEALTAASVAALTIYDMCKAVDRSMRIDGLRVIHKAGGKSGEFRQS